MELFTPGHLIVIVIVALVLFFGWKQLPDMARSVGRSLRVFKTEIKGMGQDDRDRDDAEQSATGGANDRSAQEAPRAIDPPRAEVVRPNGSSASQPASSGDRPRPTPRPRA